MPTCSARRGLAEALAGHDVVLHLAAAKSGDLYAQYAGTVVATENLLTAMTDAEVKRIVLISSLSVYDYLQIAEPLAARGRFGSGEERLRQG